jgi:hypothetical protein
MARVPNTNTFSLQDVYDVVKSHTPSTTGDLVSCINNSNSFYFDSNYKYAATGSLNNLYSFRNYGSGLPILSTTSASSIRTVSAISGGNITSDGGSSITARGVCWSIISGPIASGLHTSDSTGTGSFVSSITGLTPGNTYYVRAYATNSLGTAYGNEITVTVLSANFWEINSSHLYSYNINSDYIDAVVVGAFTGARAMLSYGNYLYVVGDNGASYVVDKTTTLVSALTGLDTRFDFICIAYSSYYNKIICSGQSGAYGTITPGNTTSWTGSGTISSGNDVYSLVAAGSYIYALITSNRIVRSSSLTSFALWSSLSDSHLGDINSTAMCYNPNTVAGSPGAVSVYGGHQYNTPFTVGVCHLNVLSGIDNVSLYLPSIGTSDVGLTALSAYYSPVWGRQYVQFISSPNNPGLYVRDVGTYPGIYAISYGENNGYMLFGNYISSTGGSNLSACSAYGYYQGIVAIS